MKFLGKLRKKSEGFTLVELIVVLVILAILAAFTIPAMLGFVEDARQKALLAEAREVYVAAQAVTTEWNSTHSVAADKVTDEALSSNNVKGTGQDAESMLKGVADKMKKYLGNDLGTESTWVATLKKTTSTPPTATDTVESIAYTKGEQTVTIKAGEGSV